jgi:uncharacterized membrane protein
MIPFYYETLASFPSATNSHGAVAHAHDTGKMYYAHGGLWLELANMSNLTSGTVTSVGGTGTVSGLTLSGSVTTSGNLTLGGTLSLTSSDVTTALGFTPIALASAITGYTSGANSAVAATDTLLAALGKLQGQVTARGAGTVTSVGGTGTVNGLSLTGTVTSTGNLTLGGTLSGVSLTSAVTGTLPVANGGNGTASPALVAGTNVTISGSWPNQTINATGGGVTSVSGTGTVNGLSLSGTVTSTGNLTLGGTLSGVSLTSAVTGTLPVGSGGTGTTTPALVAGTNVTISGSWPNQTINATAGSSSITWSISASGSTDYVFSGPGIVSGNTNDPVLYLYKGFTYVFVNTTGGSHPFAIRVSNGGASYTPGVSGSTTGTQTFVVPMNAPATLYYQCTLHGGMGNTINII